MLLPKILFNFSITLFTSRPINPFNLFTFLPITLLTLLTSENP